MTIRKVHQIFFKFDSRELYDYHFFAQSHNAFRQIPGWEYRLWNEADVEHLCETRYPQFWETYKTLKYDIMRVDAAKYMIADSFPYSVIADLDVLPLCHLDEFITIQPYVFDRCSMFFMYRDRTSGPAISKCRAWTDLSWHCPTEHFWTRDKSIGM